MKILWITNILLPPACKKIGVTAPVSGGWMYSIAQSLISTEAVELSVATIYRGTTVQHFVVDAVEYWLLPHTEAMVNYSKALEECWPNVIDKTNPDVVHIHGTEYQIGLPLINAYPNLKYVVSMQGLLSVYARYYYGGIGLLERLRSVVPRNILKREGLRFDGNDYKRRGYAEIEYFKKVKNVIGRTEWDKTHALNYNPELSYHFCNECLRNSFYKGGWNLDLVEKHSIFLSQAGRPLKGLHKVLQAAALLKERYPSMKIYVAGRNITKGVGSFGFLRLDWYGRYIARMIKKFALHDRVVFTGLLEEEQMYERMKKSHVFVCPSSIENSPNSLGEAQLVGTPVVSSITGGVLDMAEHRKTALLYRFEEHEMLARYIAEVFENNTLADELSKKGREVALARHDWDVNTNTLLSIYSKVKSV